MLVFGRQLLVKHALPHHFLVHRQAGRISCVLRVSPGKCAHTNLSFPLIIGRIIPPNLRQRVCVIYRIHVYCIERGSSLFVVKVSPRANEHMLNLCVSIIM